MIISLGDDCKNLKTMLRKSVSKNYAEGLLLSGGLDSSILATMLQPKYSFTVAMGRDAPDLPFAKLVAKKYSENHLEIITNPKKILLFIEQVIQIFKTFDPIEIRNSSVSLIGMRSAKDHGCHRVMTGDGGDELFAGYNYLSRYYQDIKKLDSELQRLWRIMHFSSKQIGRLLGVDVRTPFVYKEFANYAKSIDPIKKIGMYSGHWWGKLILRQCFESELGKEIVWRPKLAQEQGAGIIQIKNTIINNLDNMTFHLDRKKALSEGVRIRGKEHLYYYNIFRRYFSTPKEEDCPSDSAHCPECNGCLNWINRFCRICGAFPVKPK